MEQYNYLPAKRSVHGDLSSPASIAFVCVSALLVSVGSLVILAVYHCTRSGRDVKPAPALLPLPAVPYRSRFVTRRCVVCLIEFEDGEAVKVMPGCGHVFHPGCIDRWIVERRSCPVCRRRVESIGVDRGGAREEQVVVVIRLERSWSWCCDRSWGEVGRGMQRTCSF